MKSVVISFVFLLLIGSCGSAFGAEASGETALATETAKEELQVNMNVVWTYLAVSAAFLPAHRCDGGMCNNSHLGGGRLRVG